MTQLAELTDLIEAVATDAPREQQFAKAAAAAARLRPGAPNVSLTAAEASFLVRALQGALEPAPLEGGVSGWSRYVTARPPAWTREEHVQRVLQWARERGVVVHFSTKLPLSPPVPGAQPAPSDEAWAGPRFVVFDAAPATYPSGPFGGAPPVWLRLLHEVAHAIVAATPDGMDEDQAARVEQAWVKQTYGVGSPEWTHVWPDALEEHDDEEESE